MNQSSPIPTLAGFAAWLAASANSMTEAAAKASTAGDPARGRQLHNLAQFLRPIAKACEVFAAGQEPELSIAGDATAAVTPATVDQATAIRGALTRATLELQQLQDRDEELMEELVSVRRKVELHGAAKQAVISRMNAELKELRGLIAD